MKSSITNGIEKNVYYSLVLWVEEQEYIWFRGGDLNNFRDIQKFPFSGRVGLTPRVMTYIPSDAT
jgi:hypothetical protein